MGSDPIDDFISMTDDAASGGNDATGIGADNSGAGGGDTDSSTDYGKSVPDAIADTRTESNGNARSNNREEGRTPAKGRQDNLANPTRGQDQRLQDGQQRRQIIRKSRDGYINEDGDLTDQNGNVIAKNGQARRFYQQAQRERQRSEMLQQQVSELTNRLNSATGVGSLPREYGLSDTDVRQAMELARLSTTDPVRAAREVVARVVAMGHNVTEILGDKVGDNLDMAALTRLITQASQPRQQEPTAEQQRALEVHNKAVGEYQRFLDTNEHADVHEDDIARLSQQQGVHPQIAYNRLANWAAKNGFDFSRPLGPQLERRIRETGGEAPNGQQRQATPRPINSGGSTRSANGAPINNRSVTMADADDDWGTIIRNSMN